MINIEIIDQVTLIAFWLSFSRWVGILWQLPIYDNVSIPSTVKVMSALILSYAFFPQNSPSLIADIKATGLNNLWIMTAFEVFVGIIMGYFVKMIMSIFVEAGSLISQQIGLNAMRYFDPSIGQQVGPLEQMIHWTVLIMVLSSGALLPMFKAVHHSFDTINLLHIERLTQLSDFFLYFFKSLFSASLLLASPLILLNLLISVIMGIIARTVPQMNILSVSFVVNIGLGLFVLVSISSEFFQVALNIYIDMLGKWFQFFG